MERESKGADIAERGKAGYLGLALYLVNAAPSRRQNTFTSLVVEQLTSFPLPVPASRSKQLGIFSETSPLNFHLYKVFCDLQLAVITILRVTFPTRTTPQHLWPQPHTQPTLPISDPRTFTSAPLTLHRETVELKSPHYPANDSVCLTIRSHSTALESLHNDRQFSITAKQSLVKRWRR